MALLKKYKLIFEFWFAFILIELLEMNGLLDKYFCTEDGLKLRLYEYVRISLLLIVGITIGNALIPWKKKTSSGTSEPGHP